MMIIDSPWAEILLLAARVAGFGAVFAACCRSIFSFSALAALLLTMIISFYPSVSGRELDLGQLLAVGGTAGTGTPMMFPLTIQFFAGLFIGVPAAGVALSSKLFAHWANALVDPRASGEAGPGQRSLERALVLLGVLSMAPFFSGFFRFFAEGFLVFPFRSAEIIFPAALWQVAAAAGKMAFAASLLFLLPAFVLLLGFGLCVLLFQRIFPALLSESGTRAILVPCLLLSLALGMYRFSLACSDGTEQALRPEALHEIRAAVSNVR